MRNWPAVVKEAVWHFLTKLNILSAYKPATVLFCIYTNELKTYVHTETYTGIFTDSLFIIAQTWKQPRGPSVVKCTMVPPDTSILVSKEAGLKLNIQKTKTMASGPITMANR